VWRFAANDLIEGREAGRARGWALFAATMAVLGAHPFRTAATTATPFPPMMLLAAQRRRARADDDADADDYARQSAHSP
jgi:hypothetical protein